MKKILTLLMLVVLAACTTQTVVNGDQPGVAERTVVNERTVVSDQGNGRVITAVTGSGSRPVSVTIDNIELYSADKGWITVAGDEDTYDLNAMEGLRLAGDQEVDAGTYTQLRLDVSSATVAGQDVQVPGEKFIVPMDLTVPPGGTAVVVLDVHGDESVRVVNSAYVFTPIVSVNTCVDGTAMVNGKTVTTSCRSTPVVRTYEQDIGGRVVVNTVVREVPVIHVERTTVINNTVNTTVIQREVVRDQTGTTTGTTSGTNGTANSTGRTGTSSNTTNGTIA